MAETGQGWRNPRYYSGLRSRCEGPEFSECTIRYHNAADANCWFPHHQSSRFSRKSHSHEVAVSMNRHAVFIDLTSLQINFVAAYPATIGVFEVGRMHFAPSLDIGLGKLVNVL